VGPSTTLATEGARPEPGAGAPPRDWTVLWQIAIGCSFLLLWEFAGRSTGSPWISRPSLVADRLLAWTTRDLHLHIATTLGEVFIGLTIGIVTGVLVGLLLGRLPLVASVLRPIIMALYSLPHITLTPIFIMYFGLDMMPKIILVSVVVFFLMFFNTFSGVQAVDKDMILSLQIMGSTRLEVFRKVIAPACTAWIIGGLKIALPYALVAATAGEMLAARRGIGFLISDSASQFDMAGLYAGLLILMVIGIAVSEAGSRVEKRALRWRDAAE
jgi:NitT/TauT family transport system permease protein